jgi:3-phosphoshikimate 1-carboxyvinyltransferase
MPAVKKAATLVPARRLRGDFPVPGDKSITHRALLLNAIAHGPARVTGAGLGEDCLSTLRCLHQLGVEIRRVSDTEVIVQGRGREALVEPADVLDCGNSGTTMRLILGLLAGLPFSTALTGDESLNGRPMARITGPLIQMGARISGRDGANFAPLAIDGRPLAGITYQMPVASAQLKSALLLASVAASGRTVINQPAISRDHTELMLAAQGVKIETDGLQLAIEGGQEPTAVDVHVPGDVSTAAFWLVAAAIHPDAEITLRGVGVNPTRSGVLTVLGRMRAGIEVTETPGGAEPVADVHLRSSGLRATNIGGDEIPTLIDELPALALAATQAEGTTEIRDAAELRIKETDRIAATAAGLRAMGADIHELDDGLIINGPTPLTGATVNAEGDHRLAMTFGIAGLIASGETIIDGADSVDVSYPGFWDRLRTISEHD